MESSKTGPPPNGFRTFLIVWGTQSISVFGSALTLFAINIWLTQTLYPLPSQKPQLAAALSAINLAFAIPLVFGAPLAGAWVDRHDRKRTMLAMDFVSGGLSILLMMLMVNGRLALPSLVIIIAAFSFVSAFHGAAFDTSYVMLVPEKQLPRANGMMQTIWSLSGILSPMLAALIVSLPALARQGTISGPFSQALASLSSGVPLAIAIDAATFFFAGATLIFLTIPSPQRSDLGETGKPKKSVGDDIRFGAVYIWRRKPLLWLLGTFALANLVSGPIGIFQPLMVKFNLAPSWLALGYQFETALALLATIGSIGGVAGGVLISAWGGLKTRRVLGVLVPLIVDGLALIVFGLSTWLYVTAAMVFLSAALVPFMNSHSQTIWQSQVAPEQQGRVFAVRRLIAQFTWPLSAAFAGWAGGRFNPGSVLAVMGAFLAIFATLQLFNPILRRVEDKQYLDSLAASQGID